jgi:hypothetical protein
MPCLFRQFRTSVIWLSFATLAFAHLVHSQAPKPAYPARLPYSFSNFVWWTDEELRVGLKKRIPGLSDEVATTTAAEGRIRDALTAMLKEKGIVGQVQSEEPSLSALQPVPPELIANIPDDEFPPSGKPSIVFEVFRPQVLIGKVTVQANDANAQRVVEREVKPSEGRLFREGGQAFSQWHVERALKREAYFGEQVFFRCMPPYRSGDRYLVDINVIVDSGPEYHVASITADGGPLFAGKDLSQFFTVRAGDPAVPAPFGRIGPELRAYYEQNGFADVQIKANPVIDAEHATVSYALQVIPGPVYHLRTVAISKLNPEQEKRVRELLGMTQGDIYRDQAITGLYHKISDEPLLKGYTFSFSPKRDKAAAALDLSLSFFREDGSATVTVK